MDEATKKYREKCAFDWAAWDALNQGKYILRYVRGGHRRRRGILIATKDGFGWSLCSKRDPFVKEIGALKAVKRMEQWPCAVESIGGSGECMFASLGRYPGAAITEVPHSAFRDILSLNEDAKRYFKDKKEDEADAQAPV